MESTKIGFVLDFWNYYEVEDADYFHEIKNLLIFHLLFIMMIWCILKTILSKPGYLRKEYVIKISLLS